MTRRTGDEGVDLVLDREGERSIAQCKRYRGQIGQPLVRDFYGALVHENAKRGYFVTTGRFSLPAQTWAEGKNITLVDGVDLLEAAGHLGTSTEGLAVGAEISGACEICSGGLLPFGIGMGAIPGVGRPKTNAVQCVNCKAIYELNTKRVLIRGDRSRQIYSCDWEGLPHNLRVSSLSIEGDAIKVLQCMRCATVFDFNGNRITALTEMQIAKLGSLLVSLRLRDASGAQARQSLFRSALEVLLQLHKGFVVFECTESEGKYFVQFA